MRFLFVILQSQVVSDDVGIILPMLFFGGLVIIAGFLSLLLPETHKQRLPETLDDAVFQWVSTRRYTDVFIFFMRYIYFLYDWLIASSLIFNKVENKVILTCTVRGDILDILNIKHSCDNETYYSFICKKLKKKSKLWEFFYGPKWVTCSKFTNYSYSFIFLNVWQYMVINGFNILLILPGGIISNDKSTTLVKS